MLVDSKTAVMTQEEFDDLLEYSCTIPTGDANGKRWKRNTNAYRPGGPWPVNWVMGEFCDFTPEYTGGICWREIVVVSQVRPERVIRLATFEPCVITTEQYERMRKDIEARHIAGCTEVGDYVLAKLLIEHEPNYREAKAANAERLATAVGKGA